MFPFEAFRHGTMWVAYETYEICASLDQDFGRCPHGAHHHLTCQSKPHDFPPPLCAVSHEGIPCYPVGLALVSPWHNSNQHFPCTACDLRHRHPCVWTSTSVSSGHIRMQEVDLVCPSHSGKTVLADRANGSNLDLRCRVCQWKCERALLFKR